MCIDIETVIFTKFTNFAAIISVHLVNSSVNTRVGTISKKTMKTSG